MSIEAYINQLESNYLYCFSLEEIQEKVKIKKASILTGLYRKAKQGRIVSIKRGIYIILPLQNRERKYLNLSLYVDDLCQKLNKRYYIALHSAALRYGASHQAIMSDFVMVEHPNVRKIDKEAIQIRFYSTTIWPKKNIIQKKSDAGYYNVSTPALTIADLIHFQNRVGGYNRVYTTIHELLDRLEKNDLKALCSWYPYKKVLQRMGYMLSSLDAKSNLLDIILNRLKKEKIYNTLLVEHKKALGNPEPVWKIDANVLLESDL